MSVGTNTEARAVGRPVPAVGRAPSATAGVQRGLGYERPGWRDTAPRRCAVPPYMKPLPFRGLSYGACWCQILVHIGRGGDRRRCGGGRTQGQRALRYTGIVVNPDTVGQEPATSGSPTTMERRSSVPAVSRVRACLIGRGGQAEDLRLLRPDGIAPPQVLRSPERFPVGSRHDDLPHSLRRADGQAYVPAADLRAANDAGGDLLGRQPGACHVRKLLVLVGEIGSFDAAVQARTGDARRKVQPVV